MNGNNIGCTFVDNLTVNVVYIYKICTLKFLMVYESKTLELSHIIAVAWCKLETK